jgi:hypothetical protein
MVRQVNNILRGAPGAHGRAGRQQCFGASKRVVRQPKWAVAADLRARCVSFNLQAQGAGGQVGGLLLATAITASSDIDWPPFKR